MSAASRLERQCAPYARWLIEAIAAMRRERRLAQHARYQASNKGRARNSRYEASAKGRERTTRWRDTVPGIFSRAKCALRASQSRHGAAFDSLTAELARLAHRP
jgi:hypothetical protein